MRDGKNNSLKLDEAQALTPPVSPVEAMRRQLAVALFGGVSEADVQNLATKLKSMAMEGDLKAAKLLLDLILPKDRPATPSPPPAESGGLKLMAEALHDLVDEIRIGKANQARVANDPLLIQNGHDRKE